MTTWPASNPRPSPVSLVVGGELIEVLGELVGTDLLERRAALRQRSGVNTPIEPADIARLLGITRAKIDATPPT